MRHYSLIAVTTFALTVGTWGCSGVDEESSDTQPSAGTPSQTTNTTPSASGGSTNAATNVTPPANGGNTNAETNASTGNNGVGSSTGGSGSAATTEEAPSPPLDDVDCTDTATDDSVLSRRYDATDIAVTGKEKTYHAATNWWHKYTAQTVTLNGLGFTVGNEDNLSVPQTDGAPIGYPTLYIGSYSGTDSAGSNLPKQVSALTSVPTIFDTNATSLETSNINAAYDVWFTATEEPLPAAQYNPGKGGAYLMVWLFDPASRQPRGKNQYPAHTVEGVTGSWDVWIDNTDPLCISYVSTTPMSSLAFDLNAFIQDSVTNSYGITDSMYLSVVFAGFEIWGGGNGLKLKQFCADVK